MRLHAFILFTVVAAHPAAAQITAVSSANYSAPVAPASLVTLFGSSMASDSATARLDANGQLPTELAGVTIQVAGQQAQLLYVSPTQINMVMPASIASGTAEIDVTTGGTTRQTTVEVRNAAPALFSLDASGNGAGSILNGVTYAPGPFTVETLANLGDDKRTRLSVYGTGIRYAGNPFLDPSISNAAAAVTATALDSEGNVYTLPVEYAGAAPVYFGLDQVNIVLPPELDGAGTLSLTISTATASSNVVAFTVNPLPEDSVRLVGLLLAQSSVAGGNSTTGTVTLNAPARTAGFSVTLTSSADFVQPPSSVTVPAGDVTASFTIPTASTGSGSATLTAAANGISRTALLIVNGTNAPALTGLTIATTPVEGGASVTGTVALSGAAPAGGAVVQLASNSDSAQTPASVTVASGLTSATFTITTSSVSAAQKATITASYSGGTQSAVLTVNPVFTFTLGAASVTGGQSVSGTITLGSAAPAGGAMVSFASNDLLGATVTPFISIPGGQSTASVTISTNSVPLTRTVTITATYRSVALKASLTVLSPNSATLGGISLSPSTVKGGATVTGTVSLSMAGMTPVTVTLTSSNKLLAQLPALVTVPAGQSSAKFTISTTAVSSPQTVTISGTAGGVTRSASLVVQ